MVKLHTETLKLAVARSGEDIAASETASPTTRINNTRESAATGLRNVVAS